MSEENVELVRRAFAEFAATSWVEEANGAGLVAPDAEFDFSALYPDGPIVRGIEGWRGYVDALPFRALNLEPERFFDVDDRARAGLRARHRPRAGQRGFGRDAERARVHNSGWRLRAYEDLWRSSEALEATGLSE